SGGCGEAGGGGLDTAPPSWVLSRPWSGRVSRTAFGRNTGPAGGGWVVWLCHTRRRSRAVGGQVAHRFTGVAWMEHGDGRPACDETVAAEQCDPVGFRPGGQPRGRRVAIYVAAGV